MFTGLIEEIGEIKRIQPFGNALRLTVSAKKILSDLKIDDSVAINGVCQTAVAVGNDNFTVEAVEETLKKSTFSSFRIGQKVNLERAMLPTQRLGGHLVQGHVDCVGKIKKITDNQSSFLVEIAYPKEIGKYLVENGSICVNGVSLTIARLTDETFTLSVIPHTWKVTTFTNLEVGFEVNLEVDLLGKYVEKMLLVRQNKNDSGLTEARLKELGF